MEEKFGVVLVAGLAFFGFIFIFAQADGGLNFDTSEDVERMTYADQSFGAVGESNVDFRTIEFGDFTVGEARGSIRAFNAETVSITDSWIPFVSDSLFFQYNATQPREANITFEVLGRQGSGSVYVDVNGERVFEEKLIASGTPEITVPAGTMERGMNDIRIGTNGDFLSSSEYSLEEVDVRVNDRKFHDYRDSFQVYQYEIADYVASPMVFNIAESIKSSPLRVEVNGNRVYSKNQVRTSPEEVEVTPGNADLHPGSNTVTFSTDRESKYVIENAQLTMRYIGPVQTQRVELPFEMNESQLDYAERDDTEEYIAFNYRSLLPSARPLQIQLNGETWTRSPQTGNNRFNISEDVLEQDNQLEIDSNGTYNLESLRVFSVRDEG